MHDIQIQPTGHIPAMTITDIIGNGCRPRATGIKVNIAPAQPSMATTVTHNMRDPE